MSTDSESASPSGMLDEPSLSRQWVVRRLQRAYMVDRWGGAFRSGLVRSAPSESAAALRSHAEAAHRRAETVRAAIHEMGSVPYASLGVLRFLSGLGGRLLGRLTPNLALRHLVRISRFTLGEYDALVALSDEAPGVPDSLAERLRSLLIGSRAEVDWLEGRRR